MEKIIIESARARNLQKEFKYKEWRNFNNLIKRAKNLISHGIYKGEIKETRKITPTGYGAKRLVLDYVIDKKAYSLIKNLASGFKLSNAYGIRNEIVVLSLIKKYCDYKNIFCEFQFILKTKKYDMRCGKLLIEFDEPHHKNKRQYLIDKKKDSLAAENGFEILRVTLNNDIIDIIKIIDRVHERIRSKGDQALFGGHTTLQMKTKLGVPGNRPLADFLPTITIKAKDLAAEITNFNVKKNELRGENPITGEHVKNNRDVRDLLAKSGIKPENLPAEEDIKKLERRVKSDDKKFITQIKKDKSKNL